MIENGWTKQFDRLEAEKPWQSANKTILKDNMEHFEIPWTFQIELPQLVGICGIVFLAGTFFGLLLAFFAL
jgi:hypothetical protein